MATLNLVQESRNLTDIKDIQVYLQDKGIQYEQWSANAPLTPESTQEEILEAYAHALNPFMKEHGFKDADVINVTKETPGIEEIRKKFLAEHTHSEDEVRFFVGGEGTFWFHLDSGEVFNLHCTQGDFLSVPAGYKHWFDLAPKYEVKAIRVFSNMEGWTPNYTHSGIDKEYL